MANKARIKRVQSDPGVDLLVALQKLTQQNIPNSLRRAAERQITRIQLGVFDGYSNSGL